MRLKATVLFAAMFAVLPFAPAAMAQDTTPSDAADSAGVEGVRNSVVKIFSTIREPDLTAPWMKESPSEISGTGFVIAGDRVLTNAHVVEHAKQVFIQPPQSSDKLRAEVLFQAPGIDLALLQIKKSSEREEFHADHPALDLAESLPEIGATVRAIGFPVGGEQQSITEGVVSRIEYTGYYYDTPGLRIQVDAALNHGNSGGPVVEGERVIGVVFSGIEQADNIGFVIPAEEVFAFLDDIEDGTYEGRPVARGITLQTLDNPGLRAMLGLDKAQTGLLMPEEPKEDAEHPFVRWDVLDKIGPHDIDNAGLITLEGDLRLGWAYEIPRLAVDGLVPVTVIRDGQQVELKLPVSTESKHLMPFMGSGYPDYFIYGPLVFTPVYREHFWQTYTGYLAGVESPIALRASDKRDFDGEQLVVVPTALLPHAITKGYEITHYPTVKSVNGTKIKSLSHLIETLRDFDDEFVIFEFYDRNQETLVFSHAEIVDSIEEILDDNGIRSQMSKNMNKFWDDE